MFENVLTDANFNIKVWAKKVSLVPDCERSLLCQSLNKPVSVCFDGDPVGVAGAPGLRHPALCPKNRLLQSEGVGVLPLQYSHCYFRMASHLWDTLVTLDVLKEHCPLI